MLLIIDSTQQTEKIVIVLSIAFVTIFSLLIICLYKSSRLKKEIEKLKQNQ